MHPESLRRLHLLDHAFRDPHFDLLPRALDAGWQYAGLVPAAVSGFNPFVSAAMVCERSRFHAWSRDSLGSAKPFNQDDHLVREALWIAHDYLHAWAYRAVHHLRPGLGLATRSITRRNVEAFAFAHLVTEAAAVAGLDYWYLSVRNVEARCAIGSTFEQLAVHYRERDRREYRRFNPGLNVQDPGFFEWLCDGYLTGSYPGFSADDLKASPRLFHWLVHELRYGIKQRRYIRQWLHYLAGRPDWGTVDWDAPVRADKPWMRALVREVGELLWQKVKGRKTLFFPRVAAPGRTWRSDARASPDPRFTNMSLVPRERLPDTMDGPAFQSWFHQHLSGFDFARFDPGLLPRLPALIEARSVEDVYACLGGQPRLTPDSRAPRDLLVLS